MDLYWLEQSEADVAEGNAWLSPSEILFLDGLRFAKRRADWRLGRWTAKRALSSYFNLSDSPSAFAKTEIHSASSGAPEVFFGNKLADVTISLSHRNGRAICAVGPPAIDLGCDLEFIEPHSDSFIADYFAAEEQALVPSYFAADRPRLLAVLWSGKESVLKALHAGLRLDTRCVVVDLQDASNGFNRWSPLQVRYTGGRIFHGWWQEANNMIQTVVAAPPPAPPIPLQITAHFPVAEKSTICSLAEGSMQ